MSMVINPFWTANSADPYIGNVVFLSGFEGADASTAIDDESVANHTMTAVGSAQIDTAQFKFGTSSALFNGTTSEITAPDSADWDFGSGDFTVEGWFRFNSNTATQVLVGQWATNGGGQRSWNLVYNGADPTDTLQGGYSTVGNPGIVAVLTSAWTPTVGVWYHIALDVNTVSTWRIYVDGVMLGKGSGLALFNSNTTLRLGANGAASDTLFFNGWMDEVRITKGVSRYGAVYGDGGFTPPTAAFPRI